MIRNLERFCNEILSNKLLWAPQVLEFFQVPPKKCDLFEKEREKRQNICSSGIDFNQADDKNARSTSYCNFNDFVQHDKTADARLKTQIAMSPKVQASNSPM